MISTKTKSRFNFISKSINHLFFSEFLMKMQFALYTLNIKQNIFETEHNFCFLDTTH